LRRSPLIAAFYPLSCSARWAADKVFFGNLHSHTSYSDGSGTPSEAYAHARDVAKLDFMAITEHNIVWLKVTLETEKMVS